MLSVSKGPVASATIATAAATAVWDELASSHTTTGTYGARQGVEHALKTVTFDGNANTGAVGNVPLFTVTGTVEVIRIVPRITTGLGGATATIALGVTGQTGLFIAASLATSMTAGKYWFDATTIIYDNLALPAAVKEVVVENNIVGTVAVAAVTSGVVVFEAVWRPISAGATLA